MRVDTAFGPLRARHRAENHRALADLFERMREDVQARHDAGVKRLISSRWDAEVSDVVFARNYACASEVALRVAKALSPAKRGIDGKDYDPAYMKPWLQANANIAGPGITQHASDLLDEADDDEQDDDPVNHVFDILATTGAAALALRMVTTSAGFAARDAAEAVTSPDPNSPDDPDAPPSEKSSASKMWSVNSSNPRPAHASMDGEMVAMSDNFSNGMAWPGDPEGGPDENAGCQCSLTILGG